MNAVIEPFSKEALELMKGGVYKHYKGNRYKVLSVARHTETGEEMVIYHALEGEKELWVRPLKMFCETVTVDGKEIPRFRLVTDR